MRYYDYINRPRPICKNIIQIGQQGERGERGERGLVGPTGPRGLQGEKGEQGEPGIQGVAGVKGDVGPTGPRGQGVEVRDTFTIEPNERARVISTQTDDATLLDFYIPKGDYGVSEPIQIGDVKTAESQALADVVDRYEQGVHYFDFTLPKGEKGEQGERGLRGEQGIQGVQGDKGEVGPTGPQGEKGDTGPRGLPGEIGISERITIDATETIGADEEASVQDDKEGYVHHLTFYIPQGATGPQGEKGERGLTGEQGPVGDKGEVGEIGPTGPTGPQGAQGIAGPTGLTPDINASVCDTADQEISNGQEITLDEEITKSGLKIEANGIVVSSGGTYLINYSVNRADGVGDNDCVAVAINGVVEACSKRQLSSSANAGATFIKSLNRDDKITLVPAVAQNRTLKSNGTPSAMLTAILISF